MSVFNMIGFIGPAGEMVSPLKIVHVKEGALTYI